MEFCKKIIAVNILNVIPITLLNVHCWKSRVKAIIQKNPEAEATIETTTTTKKNTDET